MLNAWEKYWNNNNYGYFIFIEKESKTIIGSGGAEKIEFANEEYFTLYYRLDPKATRNEVTVIIMSGFKALFRKSEIFTFNPNPTIAAVRSYVVILDILLITFLFIGIKCLNT